MKLDRGSRTQFCWYLTLVHPPSAGGWWGKRGSWLVVPGVNSRKLRLLRLHWMTLTCTAPLSSESVVSLGFLLICWQLQYCNVVLHIRQSSTQKALDISLVRSYLYSLLLQCIIFIMSSLRTQNWECFKDYQTIIIPPSQYYFLDSSLRQAIWKDFLWAFYCGEKL